MTWEPEFEELMPDTVHVERRTSAYDEYGNVIVDTALAGPFKARVLYAPRAVVSIAGETVLAGIHAWVAGDPGITAEDKVVLPDGSTPPIFEVERIPDEDGIHHTVIHFR